MHGMFRANGGCGYVKKPDFMLKPGSDDEIFDPKVRLHVKTTLKVSVLQLFFPSHDCASFSYSQCLKCKRTLAYFVRPY